MPIQGVPLHKVAIVAALPREIAALVKRLDPYAQPDPELKTRGIWLYRSRGTTVVAGGMGTARVTLAVDAALQAEPQTTHLVSVGLAGACAPSLQPGKIVQPGVAIDVRTGERFETGLEGPPLATTETIADVREKTRLAAAYGAVAVDMEAATVGRLAQMRQLYFTMVKAISDAHDFDVASLSRFADAQGHFRTAAFALQTAMRPHTWGHAMELGRHSQKALQALTDQLFLEIMAER